MGFTGTEPLSAEDTESLIHELRVHQIKLEIQNEELRRTEEALRRSEAKYAEAVERANDGVVVVQDEVFKFVNRAWTKTTGFSVEEMMKMGFTEVIPPEYKEMTLKRYKARLAGENPPPIYEGKLLCKDGSIKDVEISASIIEYEGRPANLAVIRNITVRKQAEKVLTFLAQTSGSGPESGFFESLANYLATNLGMDFVCINRLEGDGLNVKTVAVFRDGRFENTMVCSLKDTPYGRVVGKEVCCFSSGVCVNPSRMM
jgi:PAS domain S-box-containing protein